MSDNDLTHTDRAKCKIFGHVPPEGFEPGFSALKISRPVVFGRHEIVLECERCGEDHAFTESDFDQ